MFCGTPGYLCLSDAQANIYTLVYLQFVELFIAKAA
jgi:hypothetical protein